MLLELFLIYCFALSERYYAESRGNDSLCFECLPVYDRMTWFGAFAHCKALNRTLYPRNFSNHLHCNTSRCNETSLFWTGRLYEADIDPNANWTWLNGSVFEEWDKWPIIITDVGCDGCSFWRDETIYLTSNCSRNFSYLCDRDGDGKF